MSCMNTYMLILNYNLSSCGLSVRIDIFRDINLDNVSGEFNLFNNAHRNPSFMVLLFVSSSYLLAKLQNYNKTTQKRPQSRSMTFQKKMIRNHQ